MARCPNGHEQRLGLRCLSCGSELSYRESLEDLLALPKVRPEYGRFAMLHVGYPRLSVPADYTGEVSTGADDSQTSTKFQVAGIRGGSWLDFNEKYLRELRRWMALVGIGKSTERFVIVDTTSPLSVLALSALPKLEHTALIAITADSNSTPVEQNTSYVAISLALKRGLPVIAVSETFEREMIYFTGDKGFATKAEAMSRLLQPLAAAADDLMDLLESDMKLGVRMHSLSAIVAGSKSVYGVATNAFMAQSNNISVGRASEEFQTVHSLAFSRMDDKAEFERSFGVFRNRKFKTALSAELRFHETSMPLYDLMTIYGMKSDDSLKEISEGYEAILRNVPELSAEGVS